MCEKSETIESTEQLYPLFYILEDDSCSLPPPRPTAAPLLSVMVFVVSLYLARQRLAEYTKVHALPRLGPAVPLGRVHSRPWIRSP